MVSKVVHRFGLWGLAEVLETAAKTRQYREEHRASGHAKIVEAMTSILSLSCSSVIELNTLTDLKSCAIHGGTTLTTHSSPLLETETGVGCIGNQ